MLHEVTSNVPQLCRLGPQCGLMVVEVAVQGGYHIFLAKADRCPAQLCQCWQHIVNIAANKHLQRTRQGEQVGFVQSHDKLEESRSHDKLDESRFQ